MRRLDHAFDRLAARGRRRGPDALIELLEARMGGPLTSVPGLETPAVEADALRRSQPPRRRGPAWAVAVAAAVMALASVGSAVWLLGGDGEVAEVPPTTTIPPLPTTVPGTDTAAVEALLEMYYAAYNAGDADGALDLLSGMMREVSPGNVRYRVGGLGERVEAECIPSAAHPGGMICVETYTDALHGPAGLSIESQFLYFESNGRLQQLGDPAWPNANAPGCFENRCPAQTYGEYEAALWAWLEEAHPDVAAVVGDGRNLGPLAADTAAIAAVIPYVEEFLAQSPRWGDGMSPGADLSAMTPPEAVAALYDALNSGDPEAYREFFGRDPDDVMLFFWGVGTQWVTTCEPAADPDQVRCRQEMIDEFYTRAGAVFVSTELWSLRDGELSSITEAEASSAWAYDAFEDAFGQWLQRAYPEEWRIAVHTPYGEMDVVLNAEAAAIVVARVDEFLDQSEEYPRDPGVTVY
jgi:hypothetical protein